MTAAVTADVAAVFMAASHGSILAPSSRRYGMTPESAASRPGLEPTASKRPPTFTFDQPTERTMFDGGGAGAHDPAGFESEFEIAYPIAPPRVAWPRVFPQL
jgi:hypothetical protein